MSRKICVSHDEISMVFAQEADRRLIYDLSVQDSKIVLSMFDNPNDFRWEDIRDEKDEFFNEQASINKYLLIIYKDEVVGIFYHTRHAAPIENVEFHIWFVSSKHTGKGLGTRVLTMMKEYIHTTYGITTFMMRPWIKNPQAIRTYEKCGFERKADFDLHSFFTAEEIALYGYGAYSVEETVNMVAVIPANSK